MPVVKPYTFDEVVVTLNEVAPCLLYTFVAAGVNMIVLKPPLDGITNGGWRLVYNETANGQTKIR